jgi:S1/P1 Nuclease
MKRLFAVVALWLGTVGPALAWGDNGHRLVADVAAAGLGPHAKAKVSQLLAGRSLRDVAVWPDRMRDWQRARKTDPQAPPPSELANDPEASAFVKDHRNDNQPNWHFVNLPVGVTTYQAGAFGTAPDDVVQILDRCIAVLKGQPKAGENLTPGQALRLLDHFVGDLHQPLHAASGYYVRDSGGAAMLVVPTQGQKVVDDRGGNSLRIGSGGNANFHHFWDGPMVDAAQQGRTEAQYVQVLIGLAGGAAAAPWTFPNSNAAAPETWAGDSAALAKTAYQPVDMSGLGIDNQKHLQGKIKLPSQYQSNFTVTVNQQLARAGFRLAATLNAIWP